jgi:hypothetical protein
MIQTTNSPRVLQEPNDSKSPRVLQEPDDPNNKLSACPTVAR